MAKSAAIREVLTRPTAPKAQQEPLKDPVFIPSFQREVGHGHYKAGLWQRATGADGA